MAYIAKETLTLGFTPVANAGTLVSDELVESQGWHDKVELVKGDVGGDTEAETPDATKTARATKSTAAKG